MENLDSAIAVLGTYIALMAVLAVTVEAVISWMKIPGWSPLKGKPSPEEVLNEVKVWVSEDEWNEGKARIEAVNKALKSVGATIQQLEENASISEITKAIGEASALFFRNEQQRRGWIRLTAILLGIIFAYLFQIDTLEILSPISGNAQEILAQAINSTWAHWVGVILSGMAASAGSSFWHDQSAKLRNVKEMQGMVNELMSKG